MTEMTREEAIRTIGGLIEGVSVAMLTTTSPRGWLRSRPMVAQRLPFDGTLWFLTQASAAKAADIRDRREVNVSYASPADDCYVSITGVATLKNDREQIGRLWHADYEPWFPKGLDDPELTLIRVEAREAEYWDPRTKKMVAVSELRERQPVFHDLEPGAGW